MKKLKFYLTFMGFSILFSYIIYIHYEASILKDRLTEVSVNNSELEKELQNYQYTSDNLYWQLNELSFIFEKTGKEIRKMNVIEAIEEYTNLRRNELKADSIPLIDIPKLYSNPKNIKTIHGYHYPLIFEFDENSKIKSIQYEIYKPTSRVIY